MEEQNQNRSRGQAGRGWGRAGFQAPNATVTAIGTGKDACGSAGPERVGSGLSPSVCPQ